MKKRLCSRPWMRLAAAAVSLTLIAAAGEVALPGPNPLRGGVETLARPFLRWESQFLEYARGAAAYFRGIDALKQENKTLQAQVAALSQEARAGELAQGENARLRSLLGMEPLSCQLNLEGAWITGAVPSSWSGEVTIDKGANQGLRPGQGVLDPAGALLGVVKETGSQWSTVTLLWDPAFSLGGQGTASGTVAPLRGDLTLMGEGKLAMTGLPQGESLQPGEQVVTMGDDTLPAGLLVGQVSALQPEPGGLTRSAILRPAAGKATGEVFVVTAFSQSR